MRISTNMMNQSQVSQMQANSEALLKVNKEIATGKKVSTPGDNPIAYVNISQLSKKIGEQEQYSKNGDWASSRLNLTDGLLDSATNNLQATRDLIIQAQNGTLDIKSRTAIASQVDQINLQSLTVANTKDSNGEYLFAGQNSQSIPYTTNNNDANGNPIYNYNGTIVNPRQVAIGDLNSSTGIPDPNLVNTGVSGHNVFNFSTSATTGNSNIFDTFRNLSQDLKNNNTTKLDDYLSEIDTVLNQTSQSRTTVGSSLNRISNIQSVYTDSNENLKSTQSSLQDTDMVKAIVELNSRQMALNAAQKAYMSNQSTLFDYIK
jgi:flagellar hook-associated protein 3 FlgL